LRCREWYSELAKDNLRGGQFGKEYPCVDVVECKRYKCPECGWESPYDENGKPRNTKIHTIDDWHVEFQAQMKIHMDRMVAIANIKRLLLT